MAEEIASVQEIEQPDSLTTPVAPQGDTLGAVADAPALEPTEADDDNSYRLSLNPDYHDIEDLFTRSPRAAELARQHLGRQEKARHEAEKAALAAELESTKMALLRQQYNALPEEEKANLARYQPDAVRRLQNAPTSPEVAQTNAYVNASFANAWEDLGARGVPPERITALYEAVKNNQFGRNPVEAWNAFQHHVTTQEIPYWNGLRQASRQQPRAVASPVPTQQAAPPATNALLRKPGPDQSGSGPRTGGINERMTHREWDALGREEQKRRYPNAMAFKAAVDAGLFTD